MPKVPSAPMKSLVVSNPTADLRALLRVLMTFPEGRTTVYGISCNATFQMTATHKIEKPFRPCRPIPNGICYTGQNTDIAVECHLLPEQPVPTMPPMVLNVA